MVADIYIWDVDRFGGTCRALNDEFMTPGKYQVDSSVIKSNGSGKASQIIPTRLPPVADGVELDATNWAGFGFYNVLYTFRNHNSHIMRGNNV